MTFGIELKTEGLLIGLSVNPQGRATLLFTNQAALAPKAYVIAIAPV